MGARALVAGAWIALLLGCAPPVDDTPLPADGVARVTSAGVAEVERTDHGTLQVTLDGVSLAEGVRAVAHTAGLNARVDPLVADQRLTVSFTASSGAEALEVLAGFADVNVERDRVGGRPVFHLGQPGQIFATDPWHLLFAALYLLIAFVADRVLDVFIRRRERESRKEALRFKFLAPLVRVLVWVVAISTSILVVLSVPASTALALTGGGLLLVGFASRDVAANILASIAIALDRPLHLGDFVEVAGYQGEVTKIGLRSTQLSTLEDTTVTVPNRVVAQQAVAAANYGAIEALIPVDLYVAHDAPVSRVRDLVWEAAVTSAYCCWRRPVHVVVREQPWATRVTAHAYVFDVRHQLLFVTDVTHRVKLAFDREGIAYPALPGAVAAGVVAGDEAAPPAAG